MYSLSSKPLVEIVVLASPPEISVGISVDEEELSPTDRDDAAKNLRVWKLVIEYVHGSA